MHQVDWERNVYTSASMLSISFSNFFLFISTSPNCMVNVVSDR